jgi:deoxycytidylate deaminase
MDCGIPCTPCLVEIINAGIKEIVITKYAFYDISAKYLLEHSDLKFRLYSHLCEHKNVSEELLCSDCGFDLTEDKE